VASPATASRNAKIVLVSGTPKDGEMVVASENGYLVREHSRVLPSGVCQLGFGGLLSSPLLLQFPGSAPVSG